MNVLSFVCSADVFIILEFSILFPMARNVNTVKASLHKKHKLEHINNWEAARRQSFYVGEDIINRHLAKPASSNCSLST